jgi:dTDP-4-dehydrorhamnose reductase
LTPNRTELDLSAPASIDAYFKKHSPTTVINAAAFTDVDRAERDRVQAEALNAVGPRILSEYSRSLGFRLVHFSTDQVLPGDSGIAQTEETPAKPVNYYAETKLKGEVAVLESPLALVLRVQWLYGAKKDRFTSLQSKEVFTPFADQYGSPTWTAHIARTLPLLLKGDHRGLFHFAYDDYASWFEVFAFACEHLGYSTRLIPMKTQDSKLPARRPLFSVLSNEKIKKALGFSGLGSWRAALQAFLQSR